MLIFFTDTWGDPFPALNPDWDIILASDILLCKIYYLKYQKKSREYAIPLILDAVVADVKQYPNLLKTLCFLLRSNNLKDSMRSPTGIPPRNKLITLSGKMDIKYKIMNWWLLIILSEVSSSDALFLQEKKSICRIQCSWWVGDAGWGKRMRHYSLTDVKMLLWLGSI